MSYFHEQAARLKKAGALLVTLLHVGATKDQVEQMDEVSWALAAKASDVIFPSAETRVLVVQSLQRIEKGKGGMSKHLDSFHINSSNGPNDLPIAVRVIVIAVIVLLSGLALQGLTWLFEAVGL